VFLFSCSNEGDEEIDNGGNGNGGTPPIIVPPTQFLSAADLSFLPMLNGKGTQFYNNKGETVQMLAFLKSKGLNTVRIRIWNHPEDIHSSFEEVKTFSNQVKAQGLKVWLTVHYSDTWADPGNQTPPKKWQNIPYTNLKDSVRVYTNKIMTEINPEYIQIGNEINSGFLFPYGKISENESQFLALMAEGIKSVRAHSTSTKIMIHFAGINNSDWFFNKVKSLDYDIIALSYYPIWHGKSLTDLASNLTSLSEKYQKNILIAETAYPFTLGWNDWTNNIVGENGQLILPDFPATEVGQKNFLNAVKTIVKQTKKGVGFSYWGGEWVAYNGPESTSGSSWENQALFNFQNQALSVVDEFKIE
jgi:arabinogalactan endo-1,4-beta-galactosidase